MDLDNEPCKLTVNVLMHQCPDRSLIPLSPAAATPPTITGPTGGEVFGIIVLVLFLVALATFLGALAYNCGVSGARGVEALPFYAFCTKVSNTDEGYQPAPSAPASYGATSDVRA